MMTQHYHSGIQTIHDIYFEFSCSDLIKKTGTVFNGSFSFTQ